MYTHMYASVHALALQDLPLFLIHTVSASQTGIRRNLMECLIVRKIGDPPLAYTSVGENNNGWGFTLRELMQYAGNVTLDDFNEGNVVPVRPGTKTPVCNMTQIRYRHTGFILTLRFRYWNYQAWPEAYWDLPSFPWDALLLPVMEAFDSIGVLFEMYAHVELQPQAWGFVGAEPVTEGALLSTVARIQFVGSGRFGQLSSVLIISSLVEAVVLMGIASTVTLFVARFLYGEAFREVTETTFERFGHHENHKDDDSQGKTKRKSTFAKVDRRTGIRSAAGSASASKDIEIAAGSGAVPGLSRATARLLQDLALNERLRTDPTDETLLQGYLRRRLSGESDATALKSLCLQLETSKSAQIGARLSGIAEKCVSQIGANEENMAVSELLELAERWRDEKPDMERQDSMMSNVLRQWL
eukprot:s2064_g6.t1